MLTLIIITWYVIGVVSFIYWWTEDYDFSHNELPLAVITGVLGPIAFLMGWTMHGKNPSKPIINKRKDK